MHGLDQRVLASRPDRSRQMIRAQRSEFNRAIVSVVLKQHTVTGFGDITESRVLGGSERGGVSLG